MPTIFYYLIVCLISCTSAVNAQTSDQISFSSLTNPVFQLENRSVKDYAVAFHKGTWFVFMSSFYQDRGRLRSHVVGRTTDDFRQFSEPFLIEDGRQDAWIGMASPDIKKVGDRWIMTLNSWGDRLGFPNQLFYKSSKDLRSWSELQPLAKNLTRGRRAIDAAIIAWDAWIYLIWKENQTPMIARAQSLSGNFEFLGAPRFFMQNGREVERFENYQFFVDNGEVKLLATAQRNRHLPTVFSLSQPSEDPKAWTLWRQGYTISLERQSFNSEDRANAACLSLSADSDGYHYLFYAGSNRETEDDFQGRGWNRMAIARSRDYRNWQVLPDGGRGDRFVSCESENRRYRSCSLPRFGSRQVSIVTQRSQAACIRGVSWGIEDRRLWVDKGCRAIFYVPYKRQQSR